MTRPQLCMTLTGTTLEENLKNINDYRRYIDMAELRVDFLSEIVPSQIAAFRDKAALPCILTVRRKIDGGQWQNSEDERAALFERIFGEILKVQVAGGNGFDFVDFEDDFRDENLRRAAANVGLTIIRSVHNFEGPVGDAAERVAEMGYSENEIPKIAFMPRSLDDVTSLFESAQKLQGNHILLAMGELGLPSRILAEKLGNFLTFCSLPSQDSSISSLGHLDPVTLNETYHFRELTAETKVFGITGWPLAATSSPALHNEGYKKTGLDAVYIPVRAQTIDEAIHFDEAVGIGGMSVTIPHKESVMPFLKELSPEVSEIGACNTIVHKSDGWHGYNTDAPGFSKSLLEFTALENLKGKKVSVIGAGGAACAVIYALKKLGADVCIFNRTVGKAKILAERFDCAYAPLDESSLQKLKEYNQIIVQTTSKGMKNTEPANAENDPIFFYDFDGSELLFDIVYVPEVTPVMARAQKSGCRVCNGFDMLRYQGYEQFKLFTGVEYNG